MATAIVTITVTAPTADLLEVQQYLCDKWNYTGFLPNGVTPETKMNFIKRITAAWWKSEYKIQKKISGWCKRTNNSSSTNYY